MSRDKMLKNTQIHVSILLFYTFFREHFISANSLLKSNDQIIRHFIAHTPDNSFLGFAVDDHRIHNHGNIENIALAYGKSAKYFKVNLGFSFCYRIHFCTSCMMDMSAWTVFVLRRVQGNTWKQCISTWKCMQLHLRKLTLVFLRLFSTMALYHLQSIMHYWTKLMYRSICLKMCLLRSYVCISIISQS